MVIPCKPYNIQYSYCPRAPVTGFLQYVIPSYRYLNSEYIVVNEQVGTGFIGLETKHIDVVAEGQGVSNVANIH